MLSLSIHIFFPSFHPYITLSLSHAFFPLTDIYNALTMHALVAVDRKVNSVLEIPNFWQSFAYNIGGSLFTLDDIEHGVLRGG